MDDKYRELFFQTASEHIKRMRELSMSSSLSSEEIEELHRHAHSLKGEAFVMGYQELGKYATVLEKFIKQYKDTKNIIPVEKLPIISSAVIYMTSSVDAIKSAGKEPDTMVNEIDKLQKQLGVVIEL